MSKEFLSIQGLTKKFGGLTALKELNLSISEGEILAVIGPNGSGKTTFFNLLSGHYRPTGGEIFFQDELMNGKRPDQFVGFGIARTFQTIRLFPGMTVLENVMVGCHSRARAGIFRAVLGLDRAEEKRIREESVGLLERFGEHLFSSANELASNLSYANQRRLEICRAMASQPKILLLDEPAAGMNPMESEELMRFIRDLPEDGITVLIIEHDIPVIREVSDRVVVLNQGLKIAEGSYDEIRRQKEVIEAYLGKGVGA